VLEICYYDGAVRLKGQSAGQVIDVVVPSRR